MWGQEETEAVFHHPLFQISIRMNTLQSSHHRKGSLSDMFPSLLRSIITLVSMHTLLRTCAGHSRMSPVIIRLIIVDEQRAVLVITLWLLLGNLDDIKGALKAVALLENLVHLFQGPIGCLGIEEVDTGYHEGVDDGKDDVCLVADVVKGRWCDHDHEELAEC